MEITRAHVPRALLLAVLLATAGAAWIAARPGEERPGGPGPGAAQRPEPPRVERARERVVVHVAGAVRRPGVYRLPPGARVDDAVRRAGGALPSADLDAVNLAAQAQDGRQVVVPRRAPAAPAAAAQPGAAAPAGPVNLNTADLAALDRLDGIGPGLAQRILDYREQQGGFGSVEELAEVPGIGPKRMAALRPSVTV